MSSSKINLAIDTLSDLKPVMENIPGEVIARACKINPWFSPFYIQEAAQGISHWLEKGKLSAFVKEYDTPEQTSRLGLITAGNLPFVGFHDILVGLLSGCDVIIQASRRDHVLTSWLVSKLSDASPELGKQLTLASSLPTNIDCLIATGSDNAARYFRHHFSGIPKLIRGNRTSVAILREQMGDEEIMALTKDIFLYNGLGCRNVSHLCSLGNFDLNRLRIWDAYPTVQLNEQYLAVFNREKAKMAWLGQSYISAGKSLIVASDSFSPPPMSLVRQLHFEDDQTLNKWLADYNSRIQCVVGKEIEFGESQSPKLYDYADGVDTMKFLRERTLS